MTRIRGALYSFLSRKSSFPMWLFWSIWQNNEMRKRGANFFLLLPRPKIRKRKGKKKRERDIQKDVSDKFFFEKKNPSVHFVKQSMAQCFKTRNTAPAKAPPPFLWHLLYDTRTRNGLKAHSFLETLNNWASASRRLVSPSYICDVKTRFLEDL